MDFEEKVSIKKTPSKSNSANLPSVGKKRKAATPKGNPFNRFGFSVLSETEKRQAIESSKRTDVSKEQSPIYAACGSGRSSARIATSLNKIKTDVDSSAEKENKANKSTIRLRPQNEVTRRSSRSSQVVEIIDDEEEDEKGDNDREDEYEEEEEEIDTTVRKSSRTRTVSAGYVEAHSDDEFARSSFIDRERAPRGRVPSKLKKVVKKKKEKIGSGSEGDEGWKSVDSDSKSDSADSSAVDENEVKMLNSTDNDTDDDRKMEEEEEEEEEDDVASGDDIDIDYKIQHILARQSMTPTKWQAVCGPMNTRCVRAQHNLISLHKLLEMLYDNNRNRFQN